MTEAALGTDEESVPEHWVAGIDWVSSSTEDGRVLFAWPGLQSDIVRSASGNEVERELGQRETNWMRTISAAGVAAVFHARGAAVREIKAGGGAWSVIPGEIELTAAERTALTLAGPVAARVYLERGWLRDPLRIMACWLLNAGALADLPERFAEPVLLLCGQGARAPHGYTGRGVHVEHIHDQVRAFLDQHWNAVVKLAELTAAAEERLDEEQITSVLAPAGSSTVPVLGPQDPMFQPTAIHPLAIRAAAAHWTGRLRQILTELAGEDADGPRWDEQPVAPEVFETFSHALASEISARIERRTHEVHGGLKVRPSRRGTGGDVYVVGLDRGRVPDCLAAALGAVELPDDLLFGSIGSEVELGPDGAWATGGKSPTALWTPGDARA